MSDTEAHEAQSSETAGETSPQATVPGTITQDEPLAGSDEATKTVTDIDSYRSEVDALAEPTAVDDAGEEAGGESTDGDDASGDPGPGEGEGDAPPADDPPGEEGDPAPGEPSDDTGKSDPPDRKPPQYRWRPKSETDALAMDIIKRAEKSGKEISMRDALAQAETILKSDDDEAGADNGLPKTIAESEAMLADLRQQRRQALAKDLDFEKTAELDDKIEELRDHLGGLKISEIEARRTQEEDWNTTLTQSKSRAVQVYPDSAVAGSELVKEMARIDVELKDTENPLYHSPDKPFKLAQMAANNLGIAPKSANAPAAKVAKPAASSQPVKKPAATSAARPAKPASPPMSGTARTAQASTNGQAASELDGVQDEDSWRAHVEKLRAPAA